ncbi:cytochrome c oxidase, subunit VIb [Powellomyces hirtus]|nr:cytochrome c oxidase, subunit VIb [Powellomyces hirtus]
MAEEADTPQIQIKTVGFDARFPNTNQAKNCWQNYVDYFKCVKAKGEDFPPCLQFKRTYQTLCPASWTDKWDEQREEGVFPALYEKKDDGNGHH